MKCQTCGIETLKVYDDDVLNCNSCHRKAYQKTYQKTDKYKAYQKAYQKTDKYKAYRKAYQKTDKHKAYRRAYYQNVIKPRRLKERKAMKDDANNIK